MEAIKATRYVRRVRGGSQSHIVECDDGREYCTKFLGNLQDDRVLANEYLCTRLARAIAISVPVPAIVEVDAEFIERNNKLRFMVNERTHTREALRWERDLAAAAAPKNNLVQIAPPDHEQEDAAAGD